MSRPRQPRSSAQPRPAETYRHDETALMRPDIGVQSQFRKRRQPKTYRFDSSLDPELHWNDAPVDQEVADLWDAAINATTLEEAKAALQQLNHIARPSLRWAGKAERPEFSVPTLPLFVHERLSTKGILESLQRHKRDKQMSLDLFGDPQLPIADRALKAYEHRDQWVNRLVLGDSLQVMNSLLEYESLGGQVQMIYMDPPYGVKFGSNFQPFVRKRDVVNNSDAETTREPEMVKAYRDTWELGLHSYLSYMRDRLFVARDLLHPSGSIFVQISDENLHHVRELMDEVFGAENARSVITFSKTSSSSGDDLSSVCDFILWYAKDSSRQKSNALYVARGGEGWVNYDYVRLPDGSHRRMSQDERRDWLALPTGARVYRRDNLTSQRPAREGDVRSFSFEGRSYSPGKGTFKTDEEGLSNLARSERLEAYGATLSYRRFADDFPYIPLNNLWDDTLTGGYAETRHYVVQTVAKVVQRCMLMTTDPGDLVLDPTCGSGTTAHVAEQWGRRWITADVSRVPLALARQRLLTATFSFFKLADPERGVAGGFDYRTEADSKNRKADGYGVVSHVTLKSIANDEPPDTEVLVDRPERDYGITRVTGPFVVEATIPTPLDLAEPPENGDGSSLLPSPSGPEGPGYFERMLETLRKAPRIAVGGNEFATLENVRLPARSLHINAEAMLNDHTVAVVFGPEHGAVSERLVAEAAREAYPKGYERLFVFGFAIEPNARLFIERSEEAGGIPATYVAVTPDVAMGDLLKNQRSSQVFSVTGLPDVRLLKEADGRYRVQLLGLDTFDLEKMTPEALDGADVPAWFLDTDYDQFGAFHVSQAFFPRTGAWDALKRDLKGMFADSVWDALSGTLSEPFEPGETGSVAIKVIDDRGNELMVVKSLAEAEPAQ